MKIKYLDLFYMINSDGSQNDVSDVLSIANLSKYSKVIPTIDIGTIEWYEIKRRPMVVLRFEKKGQHHAENYFTLLSISFYRGQICFFLFTGGNWLFYSINIS